MQSSKSDREWPRKYLSWSQLDCWQRSGPTHYEYFRRYLYNEPLPTTPAMQLGSRMAEMLERRDEQTGDSMLEHYRTFLPRYDFREYEVRENYGDVPLLAKPDGFSLTIDIGDALTEIHLGEFKTGRHWTQERADAHEQIDFYDLVFWKKYGIIPKNVIHWIPTYADPENGRIMPTGDFVDFPTLRTEEQLIKFGAKVMMVWNEIGELYAAEKKSIGA